MASEILQRNPTSTGNRKVFTWSSWIKLNKDTTNSNTIWYCASSGANEFKIQISDGKYQNFIILRQTELINMNLVIE